MSILTILLVAFLPFISIAAREAVFPPQGYLINCGSDQDVTVEHNGLKYVADKGYASTGNTTAVKGALPVLSTLRFFPDKSARRYCYIFPVHKGSKHLIRTTYYYGGFDGRTQPPLFNQFVDGTLWSLVNTTDDYAKRSASYYELIMSAGDKKLSVCWGRDKKHTAPNANPFISSLEVILLKDSLYNPVNFQKYALATVSRNMFGASKGPLISFPDDSFNRYWQPYNNLTPRPTVTCQSNITPSDFWNMPPAKALRSAITASRGKTLEINWPNLPPSGNVRYYYYLALYFQDNRHLSPYSWRVFNVSVNGQLFYSGANVTTKGTAVYGNEWPLSAPVKVVLTPEEGSPVGPVINAGEVLQMLPLGGSTLIRDVISLRDLTKSFNNTPPDWQGDPCLPPQYSWTGVLCSQGRTKARVTTLNLTGMGLAGTISPSIANLTALRTIMLADNKLTGKIPEDISRMNQLEILHLENNQLDGPIPKSLYDLPNIKQINLQNNHVEGDVPHKLKNSNGDAPKNPTGDAPKNPKKPEGLEGWNFGSDLPIPNQ